MRQQSADPLKRLPPSQNPLYQSAQEVQSLPASKTEEEQVVQKGKSAERKFWDIMQAHIPPAKLCPTIKKDPDTPPCPVSFNIESFRRMGKVTGRRA